MKIKGTIIAHTFVYKKGNNIAQYLSKSLYNFELF